MQSLEASIEALLFVYGEALEVKKIAGLLGSSPEAVEEALVRLGEDMKRAERGLSLVRLAQKVQLVTKPIFAKLLVDIMKSELRESLTPAAVETLAIVSYAAPISRSEIDFIRGVNSSFILRSLLIRGLIEREADARRTSAFVYRPSLEFLKSLGVSSQKELPDFEKFHDLAKKVKPQEENKEEEKNGNPNES